MALFTKKMALQVHNLKSILIQYNEKCVTLHRRAYAVPSEKDARMGGTLHNVKSVIDALSIGFLKPEKFQLLVKDNVRSECYGYAIKSIPGCA